MCKNVVHKKIVELPKYKICAAFPKQILYLSSYWFGGKKKSKRFSSDREKAKEWVGKTILYLQNMTSMRYRRNNVIDRFLYFTFIIIIVVQIYYSIKCDYPSDVHYQLKAVCGYTRCKLNVIGARNSSSDP